MLIEAGVDVNLADSYGRTPAYIASQNNHTDALKLLIEAGADVNIADEDGWTPAFIASHNDWMAGFDFNIPTVRRGKAGEVEMNVTFEINESGVIRVTADTEGESKEEKEREAQRWFNTMLGYIFLLQCS